MPDHEEECLRVVEEVLRRSPSTKTDYRND